MSDERTRAWCLDNPNSLVGGLLGEDDVITNMQSYSLLDRQRLADEGHAWVELIEVPRTMDEFYRYDRDQRRAVPHERLIAEAEQKRIRQKALERTVVWRDMLDVTPVESPPEPVSRILGYPDEDAILRVHSRFQEVLRSACPTRDEIGRLIRTAFLASLAQEEGRNPRFALGLVSAPLLSEIHSFERKDWLVFDTPRPFDIRTITKLAPACNPTVQALGVQANADGEWQIWGFLHMGSSLMRSRMGEPTPAYFRTIPLARIHAPGDFDIDVGPEKVAEIRAGRTTAGGFQVLVSDSLVSRYFRHHGLEEWLIRHLVRGMLDRRHGGTVFFVPPNSGLTDQCDIKYRFANASPILSHTLQRWRDFPRNTHPADPLFPSILLQRNQAWRDLDDATQTVASMTAVDGALVIETNLSVIGFGAVVRDIQQCPSAYRARNVEGTQLSHYDFGPVGTRHRSAICFCDQCPEALAVIASQDGGLSCARYWSKVNAVVVWSPIEVQDIIPAPSW
jgi:hypothetical protein